jgi:predicted PurR-regulated permease PerM
VYVARDLVVFLIFAAFLAYLLNPFVKAAESAAVRRSVAVIALYLTLGLGSVGMVYRLAPSVRTEALALSEGWPSFSQQLDDALETVRLELATQLPVTRHLIGERQAWGPRLGGVILEEFTDLPRLMGYLKTLALGTLIVPFLTFFLLRDSGRLVTSFLNSLPAVHIETTVAIWCEIDRIIGRYLRGVALDGLAVGALSTLGLWVLGIPYPLLLGAFSGFANVVPYLGPILGGGMAMIITLIHLKSLGAVVQVFILYLVIKALDDTVIQPLLIGGSIHLHPTLLLTSVVVGGHLFDLIGMILAVPVVTIIQETLRIVLERRWSRAATADALEAQRDIRPICHYVC